MAYQTGTASGTADLVNKLRAFGEAIGWVTNHSAHGVWHFRDAGSTMFFGIENCTGQQAQHGANASIPANQAIFLVNSTGYASVPLKDQPGVEFGYLPTSQRKVTSMELAHGSTGAGTYWFFGTTAYLHVVWARPEGTYRHMQVGMLDKKGMVYSGGQYAQGNGYYYGGSIPYSALWDTRIYNQNAVRLSGFDTFTGKLEYAYGVGDGRYTEHPDNVLVACSGNAFTGDTVLVPNRVLMVGSNNRRWYLGETSDFAVVSLVHCNPEQILTYGSEEWQVFPCQQKGNIGPLNPLTTGSGDTGYAYRLRR